MLILTELPEIVTVFGGDFSSLNTVKVILVTCTLMPELRGITTMYATHRDTAFETLLALNYNWFILTVGIIGADSHARDMYGNGHSQGICVLLEIPSIHKLRSSWKWECQWSWDKSYRLRSDPASRISRHTPWRTFASLSLKFRSFPQTAFIALAQSLGSPDCTTQLQAKGTFFKASPRPEFFYWPAQADQLIKPQGQLEPKPWVRDGITTRTTSQNKRASCSLRSLKQRTVSWPRSMSCWSNKSFTFFSSPLGAKKNTAYRAVARLSSQQ